MTSYEPGDVIDWSTDTPLTSWHEAGLRAPSVALGR